ncbi:MAG TPA: transglycosylase SLT domain-containing protein [Solirubrobacterales bacterium]
MKEGATVLVTAVGAATGARAAAAALACAGADRDRAGLLIDLSGERAPRPSLIATAAARELEERLAVHLPQAHVASRGQFCHLTLASDQAGVEQIPAALPLVRDAAAVLHLPPRLLQPVLAEPRIRASAAMLRADLAEDRPLTALVAGDMIERGLRVAVLKRPLGWFAGRLALLGAPSTGVTGLSNRLKGRLLGESGQALILALGGSFALIAMALALVAIAGAVTGKGRAQRGADLAAISAARSMRDDMPRLLSPSRLPDGSLNPRHLEKAAYLARAHAAAIDAAEANGVAAAGARVSFPDRASFVPVWAKAVVTGRLRLSGAEVEASAIAEAGAPTNWIGTEPAMASGGGYSGPLVYRNGEGMRPDVAAAFDRMAAAAAEDGLALVVNSGFRSDAEQAALFAAHPDPTWVAPPGKSLHRCATELDLGPETAYGWLAANATRFGFVQRYSWEAWHYGFTAGPPPCSPAAERGGATIGGGGGDGALAGSGGLPAFVPARLRAPLLRAASRWNVSAALLAAQLMAESNFNPFATSPAGAQGIAQFIPSTAAAYGLQNPFDPEEAMDAQAHLMSDLLRQFGDPSLALAAYNAGPVPVEACNCVSAYPETQAYVSRILALLDGAGALVAPTFEVRLIS